MVTSRCVLAPCAARRVGSTTLLRARDRPNHTRISMTNAAVRFVAPLMLCSLGLTGPSVSAQSKPTLSARELPGVGHDHDGQHDFDFEFGDWKAQLSRLQNPLSGSTTWIEYNGTSIVRKVWDGRANLGELQLEGKPGRLQGLSLRLYNPQSRQWKISWANAADR